MNGLLSLLIFLPVAGTLAVFLVPREKPGLIRWVATLFTGAEFLLSLPLWTFTGFRTSGDFFFRETHEWIPSLGAKYALGVDGIAALLILLTTLLSFISVYSSFTAITKREKEYYAFLLLETGMIGVFCALDFFLFYVFWEVMLVPMYFLIGIWGGPRKYDQVLPVHARGLRRQRSRSSRSTSSTSGFLWWKGLGNAPSFDIVHFQSIARRSRRTFRSGCSGRSSSASRSRSRCSVPRGCPTRVEAHGRPSSRGRPPQDGDVRLPGSAPDLRGRLPDTLGAVRRRRPFDRRHRVRPMVAMVQKDMKKLVAYSSVAHLGFVMLGLFALNNAGSRAEFSSPSTKLDGRPLPPRRDRLRAPPRA